MKSVSWEGREVPVLYSSRKTVAIVVTNGELTVRAPRYTGDARILAFLNQKRNWIQKHLARGQVRADMEKTVWYCGREIPVMQDGMRLGMGEGVFYSPSPEHTVAWLKREARRVLTPLWMRWAKAVGRETGKTVRIVDAKSVWGSNGRYLNLNWRLICCPPALAEYVVVHELAHEFHRDHSAAFWKKTEELLPDCRARKKELKKYSFLLTEYRDFTKTV